MHIYSVLNKLFTPKVEQNKVQDNTNEQKKNFQDESKEKISPPKEVSKNLAKTENKTAPSNSSARQQTCFVSFPKTGDTLATLYNKAQTTLKLAGVDGSEKGVVWNKQAIKFLKQEMQIERKMAFIDVVGKDSDGTLIVELYLDKEKTKHLNKILLEQDFAINPKPINKESNIRSKAEDVDVIVQQANAELLEVKPKVIDNSVWEGIPEDIPMSMPGDDYFWQGQMDMNNNFPTPTDINTNDSKTDNSNVLFNPFADPPIEPLSVYPNGIKPVLETKELPIEVKENVIDNTLPTEIPNLVDSYIDLPSEIPDSINSYMDLPIDESYANSFEPETLVKDEIKIEFNPFADPPIEPLSVYPNGVKPVVSLDMEAFEDLTKLEINVPINEVQTILEKIDTTIEEVTMPLTKQVDNIPLANVETPKEKIVEESKATPNIETLQETKPPKVVLKFGSKAKANLPKVEDDIELALDKKEKQSTVAEPEKQSLPEVKSEPEIKIEAEAKTEVKAKGKAPSPLSPEYDPFSDISLDAAVDSSNNIDVSNLLADFDSLGQIVTEPVESSSSTKKKFGR